MRIVVVERPSDRRNVLERDSNGNIVYSHGLVSFVSVPRYMAHVEGSSQLWDSGDTRQEAIGSLVISHPELFNAEVVFR